MYGISDLDIIYRRVISELSSRQVSIGRIRIGKDAEKCPTTLTGDCKRVDTDCRGVYQFHIE